MTLSVKSLVVGGSGFVGVELVRHLVELGHDLRVFDKNPVGDYEGVGGRLLRVTGKLTPAKFRYST